MAKKKWTKDEIIRRIKALEAIGEDLTCKRVKEIDSALVGAATSYFGSWGDAIKAAGLDYAEIRKISKRNRTEKVKKWTESKIIEDIKKIAETEEDLSYAFMKEKHSALVAAACNYFGSWKTALEHCGFDYKEVQSTGRKKRVERDKEWHRSLLLERLEKTGILEENSVKTEHPGLYKLLMKYFQNWRAVVLALRNRRESA